MGAPETCHVIGGEHDGHRDRAFMHSGEVGLLRGRDSRTVPARSDVKGI
jgi:hypothetical protein